MYNNSTNQLYNSNVRTNVEVNVDSLLRGLGAEPLFPSINDPHTGVTSPHVPNNVKTPTITYNNTYQPDQNSLSDAFVSLLQRLNNSQHNSQNFQTTQNLQNTPNLQNIQNLQNSNQEIPQNSNLNQVPNQVGLPNPISILNEMHQRDRRSSLPPQYTFTLDATNGFYYCQLEVFGKTFKTERPTPRKQQAKEEAALMALRNLADENSNKRSDRSEIMRLYDPKLNYIENRMDPQTKSEIWYKKQINEFPGKQPRVVLLEFCQMHRLPSPVFQPCNDYMGNTYYECIIGDKYYFKGDKSFIKSTEAKDYVAQIAFGMLYKEICEAERDQMRRQYEVGQDTRSSLLNFIESQSPNPNPAPASNELTTRLLLPNYDQGVKAEETNPSNMIVPAIRREENNLYSPRDQQQSSSGSSSPISYHPYRSPRDRLPQSPGSSNQFIKKNSFSKKFTSLLFEMAQARRWVSPEFSYENGVNGFVCICKVQGYLFRGKSFSRKMDAKESAAEEAYRYLTK